MHRINPPPLECQNRINGIAGSAASQFQIVHVKQGRTGDRQATHRQTVIGVSHFKLSQLMGRLRRGDQDDAIKAPRLGDGAAQIRWPW